MPVLGMGAIAIWIKNALIFRPGEQRWDTEIVPKAAMWDADDEDNLLEPEEVEDMIVDGHMTPALEERGLYFVSAVECRHRVFALPRERTLEPSRYALMYNRATYAELELLYMRSANKDDRAKAGPRRNRPRVRVGPPRHSPDRDIAFGLANSGVQMRPLYAEPNAPPVALEAEQNADGDVDRELNGIWQDFLRDIVNVASYGSRGEPYCILTAEEKVSATEELYRSTELPFRCAIVKMADAGTWDTLFFNRFFPTGEMLATRPKITQHYPRCQYWPRWQVLMEKLSRESQDMVRQQLLAQFRQLKWMPWSSSDRIWMSGRSESGRYIKLPEGYGDICPKIAINERGGRTLVAVVLKVAGA